MTWPVFLLRLVGRSPEQVETQKKFDEALSKLDDVNAELDEVLSEIRGIDAAVRLKNEALGATASSIPPGGVLVSAEQEKKEETNERRSQPQLGKPATSKA